MLESSLKAREECSAAIPYLTQPADKVELLIVAAALMDPYFEKGQDDVVKDKVLENWYRALKDYPLWAIERACFWWQGPDNPDCLKKPVYGKIVQRVRVEMKPIRVAQSRMLFPLEETKRPPALSPEQQEKQKKRTDEILAGFGCGKEGK